MIKIPKDKRFTIRIRDADVEFLEQNLPPEVENLSEAFRLGAKQLITGGQNHAQIDFQVIFDTLHETEQRIISEIHQNRALQTSILQSLQDQQLVRKEKFKAAAIEEILESWLKDLENISMNTSIEELERTVEYEHLKKYALDAIQELKFRKYLTIEPSGKLRWHYE